MGVKLLQTLKPFAEPKRYKVAYGGRGSGKSWTVARLLLLKASSTPIRILCTREIQNSIKESVHKLLSDQIDALNLPRWTIQNDSISHANGSEFIFKGLYTNLAKIKSLEGVDICWIEEAETISEESWQVLDPTIRKENSEIWITFNPRFEEDTIYTKFILGNMPNSTVIKVNYENNKYFPDVLREQMEHMKQYDYELYRHVWLGECKKIGDTRLFSMSEIEDAINLPYTDDEGETIWGLDVARFGDDRSVLARRYGNDIKFIDTWQGLRTTELADRVHTLYNQETRKPDAIFIDSIGVGAGVIDQLAQRGLPVIEANASAQPTDAVYLNKRAEMYYNFKKRLRYTKLPPNRDLLKEMLLIEYLYNNAGKTQLVSKDIIKKNYGKSPDLADAVALTYFDIIYKGKEEANEWRGGY